MFSQLIPRHFVGDAYWLLDIREFKHQTELQEQNVTQKEEPMTEGNFGVCGKLHTLDWLFFWVMFHSWSYLWCLNCLLLRWHPHVCQNQTLISSPALTLTSALVSWLAWDQMTRKKNPPAIGFCSDCEEKGTNATVAWEEQWWFYLPTAEYTRILFRYNESQT